MEKSKRPARKKKVNRQRSHKPRQPKPQPQNLPEPIDVPVVAEHPEPEPQSLLERVTNLFQQNQETPSATSFESISGDSLPHEAQALLDTVPDVIGSGDPGEPGVTETGKVEKVPDDAIAALMAQVSFEEQDVKDMLCEFFDWLSEHFDSDHWKLTERQVRILGRPSAQLANSIWAQLMRYIPDILTRWCESTPGATAFLLACGIVIVPKAKQQWSISRKRKSSRKTEYTIVHRHATRVAEPGPQPVNKEGMIWSQAPLQQ